MTGRRSQKDVNIIFRSTLNTHRNRYRNETYKKRKWYVSKLARAFLEHKQGYNQFHVIYNLIKQEWHYHKYTWTCTYGVQIISHTLLFIGQLCNALFWIAEDEWFSCMHSKYGGHSIRKDYLHFTRQKVCFFKHKLADLIKSRPPWSALSTFFFHL